MIVIKPILIISLCLLSFYTKANSAVISESILFEELKQGKLIAIMRHAIAPGTGDPDNFILGQCETQRNLSKQGQQQANNIGRLFRQNGISTATLYSSQWCRCLDTANELRLGKVQELPIINSFFRNYTRETQQTHALKQWLVDQSHKQATILVTHQVNITSLTGVFPRSGEIVFIRIDPSSSTVTVAGTIQ